MDAKKPTGTSSWFTPRGVLAKPEKKVKPLSPEERAKLIAKLSSKK